MGTLVYQGIILVTILVYTFIYWVKIIAVAPIKEYDSLNKEWTPRQFDNINVWNNKNK